MKGSMRRLGFGLVGTVGLLLLSLGVAAQARASVVEALDLAGLVRNADVIVIGQVVASQSHYDEHGRIVTDVEMLVESREKGEANMGRSIVVRRLGGVVGNIGMRIEGEPSLIVGERTLLFGKRLSDAVTFRSVGLAQGVMRIEERAGERWVRSAEAGAALVRRAGGGKLEKARVAVPEARKLLDLLTEIRALVAAQR